jgi:hypothetical protein
VRDPVGTDDLDATRAPPQHVERGVERTHDEVALVAAYLVGALPRDVDNETGLGHPDDDIVV